MTRNKLSHLAVKQYIKNTIKFKFRDYKKINHILTFTYTFIWEEERAKETFFIL